MPNRQYVDEREGQIDFFNNYSIDYLNEPVLIENTDGVYRGNLLEFKLNISNIGKVLFQAIKYLSRMRIKGESVPARIIIIDLNSTMAYIYESKKYINEIQKVYFSSASVDNASFTFDTVSTYKLNYSNIADSAKLKDFLKKTDEKKWYIPIDINEDCIVGWAERYYREVPNATKGDFIGDGTGKININGEIREPRYFKGLINPYTEPTNQKFKYLMDCLNDNIGKKDYGAFYTPKLYCEKAVELVMKAINKVPEGNDYIILDRCAGTGNLEAALLEKKDKFGKEVIEHCIVSTYEYYEYKVLLERLGDKVRLIIPPTEANVIYQNGKVSNADALSEDFINSELLKKYIDDERCTIILFENPPFSEVSGNSERKRKNNEWKKSYATIKMNEEIGGKATNDSATVFIWSAFKYYLRQPQDSYIVFSPIKYWKSAHIINKKCERSFIFNKKYFHTNTKSAVLCCLWSNEDSNADFESIAFDIKKEKQNGNIVESLEEIGTFPVKKVTHLLSEENDKRKFTNDKEINFALGKNGYIKNNIKKIDVKPIYNENIVGYMMHCAAPFGIACNQTQLTRLGYYGAHGYFLRSDNFLEKLPLFVAGWFEGKWYQKDLIYRSLDGGNNYKNDAELLKQSLIYTCLTGHNHCISLVGPDGILYKNELCFDNTIGETIATKELKKYTLSDKEKEIINVWSKVLEEAKKTKNYNPLLSYGIHQINTELNTFHKEIINRRKKDVPDYLQLNTHLENLRSLLKSYYYECIAPKLFKYEILK